MPTRSPLLLALLVLVGTTLLVGAEFDHSTMWVLAVMPAIWASNDRTRCGGCSLSRWVHRRCFRAAADR